MDSQDKNLDYSKKADDAAMSASYSYARGNGEDEPCYDIDFYNGFKKGVEWLMSQPLSSRLTDEEIKKLGEMYKEACLAYDNEGEDELSGLLRAYNSGISETLHQVFGRNLLVSKIDT